jgi:hypothetical protein
MNGSDGAFTLPKHAVTRSFHHPLTAPDSPLNYLALEERRVLNPAAVFYPSNVGDDSIKQAEP